MLDHQAQRVIPLTVENLSCGGCAARAEKALAALPHVRSAQVNLTTKTAQVTATPEFDLSAMDAAMRKAG